MGTIASVLQWSCTNCNVINPTESLKCLNCGTVRKVCDGTLKNSDSSNLGASIKGPFAGGGKEPPKPGDNKSPLVLYNEQDAQLPSSQASLITVHTPETEERGEDTSANRFVRLSFPTTSFHFHLMYLLSVIIWHYLFL